MLFAKGLPMHITSVHVYVNHSFQSCNKVEAGMKKPFMSPFMGTKL